MTAINKIFLPYRLINFAHRIIFRCTVAPFFGSFGSKSSILRPRGIEGIERIHIGDGVYISDAALLAAVMHTGNENCILRIGDGCSIGRDNHIYATSSIIFESEVLTANNVYVSDNSHSYLDVDIPVKNQSIKQLSHVRIGQGSWLGQNVCVIGASIGKGCIIGANSVVLSDVPDLCVAVGSPARVIRRFEPKSAAWVKVPPKVEPSR